MSSCAVLGIPIAAGLAAMGGPLSAEEHARFGAAEPICTIDAAGKVRVDAKIKRIRRRAMRKATRRPRLQWLVDDLLPEFSIKAYCRLCLGSGSTTRAVRTPGTRRRGADVHDDGSGGDDPDGPSPPLAVIPSNTASSAATVAHDFEEVLRLRAWARATLWQAGELELSEAVDVLQADAERDGLVELLGQDTVQDILAAAFAEVRDPDAPMADEASGMERPELLPADADARSPANDLPDGWDRMSGEALYSAIMRRRTEDCVTISTFRAVHFALRNGGLAALNKQAERLRGFSDHQIENLIRDLHENRTRFKAGGDLNLLRALTELMP